MLNRSDDVGIFDGAVELNIMETQDIIGNIGDWVLLEEGKER